MSIPLPCLRNRDRILIVEAGRLHPLVSFSRASTATYLSPSDTIVSAATNTPRFEYSPTQTYLGLLMEEARTNLLMYSETVSQLGLSSGMSNAATPLASYFSNSIQYPSNSGTTNYAYKQYSVSNGKIYMLTLFIKMDDGTAPVVSTSNSTGDCSVAIKDVQKPTVVSYGGGVYRVSALYTASANTSVNVGIVQYSTQSGKPFRVTGFQFEQVASTSSLRCSYIPTTSATVTRSADVVQATLSTIGISTSAGTFLIEHDVPNGQPLLYSGSNLILNSSGAGKVAIAYDNTGTAISVNGAAVTTSSTALTFSTTLDIAKSPTTSANAHIKRLVWYNSRRANSELLRLSV